MLIGDVAEQRQASTFAHRNGQACMNERLPEVRVVNDVAYRTLTVDVRHSPVVANAVAGLTFVFRERLARRANEPAVAGNYDPGVGGLPAELVHDVGR